MRVLPQPHLLVLDHEAPLLHLGSIQDVVDELQQPLARHLDGGDGLNGLQGKKGGRQRRDGRQSPRGRSKGEVCLGRFKGDKWIMHRTSCRTE